MALLRRLIRADRDYWVCPKCGRENPLTHSFCSNCGPS